MFESVCIYFGTFFLSIWSYDLANKCSIKGIKRDGVIDNLLKFMFSFGAVILLYGFRYEVGVDYPTYLSLSKYLLTHPDYNIWASTMEIGYVVLNKIANTLFGNEYGVFLLSGIILFGVLFLTLQKQRKEIHVVCAYFIFLMTCFAVSCNISRQLIAAVFLLYGCRYIIEGNFKKYILVLLIGSLFHYSVLLCLLFWFVRYFKKEHVFYFKVIMVVSCAVVVIFPQPIYQVVNLMGYGHLLNMGANTGITGLAFLLYVLPAIIFVEFYKKELIEKDYRYNYYIGLLYVQFPLQIGGYINSHIERFSIYSSIIQVLLIPAIIHAIDNPKKKRNAILLTVIWFSFYFIVMNVIMDGNWIIPYQTWL